eukprot:scaffold1782_cov414-Prasinococcus_capsulatus_cf.AAC.11
MLVSVLFYGLGRAIRSCQRLSEWQREQMTSTTVDLVIDGDGTDTSDSERCARVIPLGSRWPAGDLSAVVPNIAGSIDCLSHARPGLVMAALRAPVQSTRRATGMLSPSRWLMEATSWAFQRVMSRRFHPRKLGRLLGAVVRGNWSPRWMT